MTGALNSNPMLTRPVEPNETHQWAMELRQADEWLTEARQTIWSLESQRNELQNELGHCLQKIDTWDKEIQRLSNLYEGG